MHCEKKYRRFPLISDRSVPYRSKAESAGRIGCFLTRCIKSGKEFSRKQPSVRNDPAG